MTTRPSVNDLMAQIGPILDLAQVTEYADENAWLLVADDDQRIDVEFDDAGQRLVLTAHVGSIEEQVRRGACEVLLRWNYLWSTHGGIRAALDGVPGNVVLLLDLPLSGLQLPQLCGVVRALAETASGWRAALASLAQGNIAAPEGQFASPTMIRV